MAIVTVLAYARTRANDALAAQSYVRWTPPALEYIRVTPILVTVTVKRKP